ncbi:xanthine dehydrogenase accessory factor [Monaibacterium marinum]|uniref:Xanthine dehydrogenase accessory factor n=1 Tax=Pontivivens marinum TaxID=1690039 RepID=A0A2C9CNV1_9RHOB|nr:xanthine dehydrogenase accessory factor [Monaibacterium marinum]
MVQDLDRIPEIALEWLESGRRIALATVVQTWGSAPRAVGAQLVISDEAQMMGSVSGGCVEGAVVEEAMAALDDGQPRLLTYGVSDDDAFAVGLACGGTIRILVEPVGSSYGFDEGLLRQLVDARSNGRAVTLVTSLRDWSRLLMDGSAGTPLGTAVRDAITSDRSGVALLEDEEWFIGVHNPPLRMFIVGAVHIAQPLSRMAKMAGYAVTVIDPRGAFATAERFPDVTLMQDWPDEAIAALAPDARCAVVTLTHDPKLDDPAITAALGSDVFYLGCLGSKRTHAKRVARLTDAGFSASAIVRIHAPVGADIGAKNPAEIAVSILAQIVERLRRVETRPGA